MGRGKTSAGKGPSLAVGFRYTEDRQKGYRGASTTRMQRQTDFTTVIKKGQVSEKAKIGKHNKKNYFGHPARVE